MDFIINNGNNIELSPKNMEAGEAALILNTNLRGRIIYCLNICDAKEYFILGDEGILIAKDINNLNIRLLRDNETICVIDL